MTYKIAEQILKLSGERKQKKNEELYGFKYRLVKAANDLLDENWDLLTQDAREWVNSCVRAIKDSKSDDSIDFPVFPEEVEQMEQEEMEVLDVPTGKRVRQKRKPVLDRKSNKGAGWHMKEEVIKSPSISYIALQKLMKKKGFEVTEKTCLAMLSNVRQTLKVLQSMNLLKEPVLNDKTE